MNRIKVVIQILRKMKETSFDILENDLDDLIKTIYSLDEDFETVLNYLEEEA